MLSVKVISFYGYTCYMFLGAWTLSWVIASVFLSLLTQALHAHHNKKGRLGTRVRSLNVCQFLSRFSLPYVLFSTLVWIISKWRENKLKTFLRSTHGTKATWPPRTSRGTKVHQPLLQAIWLAKRLSSHWGDWPKKNWGQSFPWKSFIIKSCVKGNFLWSTWRNTS